MVFSQNHDQVGNRMQGDRLAKLASFEALKLAAGAVIFSPNLPLLFMGEEYGEDAPFLYFVSHGDRELIEAVRKGRKEEFAAFSWEGEPPDPQAEETFLRSRIDWSKRDRGRHLVLLNYYRELLRLRGAVPALAVPDKDRLVTKRVDAQKVITLRSTNGSSHAYVLLNFETKAVKVRIAAPSGPWVRKLDSTERSWHGTGTLLPREVRHGAEVTLRPESVALFTREERP